MGQPGPQRTTHPDHPGGGDGGEDDHHDHDHHDNLIKDAIYQGWVSSQHMTQ